MSAAQYAILVLAAFVAGAVNSVAGGGSFITFPALLLVGLSPLDANVASAVALWPGQLVSTWAYRHRTATIREVPILPLVLVSVIAGLCGGLLLLVTPAAAFAGVVPWLVAFATALFAIGSFVLPRGEPALRLGFRGVLAAQAAISLYGGYFGGGIGFLMLASFTFYGMRDVQAMNGLRLLLGLLMNGAAILAFVVAGTVRWPETLTVAAASVAGGYFGAIGAQHLKPLTLKLLITLIGAAVSVYLFAHPLR
jgi:uncharacterized membrane protein YfcA